MRTAIFIFALFCCNLAAAALPEGVSAGEWDALLTKTRSEGEASDTGGGTYLTLRRIEPADKSVSHRAEYFSLLGAATYDGGFAPWRVESVFENWEKEANGHWRIDQWIFTVSLSGNLGRSYHGLIVEDADGSVLEHDLRPLSEEDAEAAWAPRLRSWL